MQDDKSVNELAARLGMDPNVIWEDALILFETNAQKYLKEHPECSRAEAGKVGIASTYLAGLIDGMERTVQKN